MTKLYYQLPDESAEMLKELNVSLRIYKHILKLAKTGEITSVISAKQFPDDPTVYLVYTNRFREVMDFKPEEEADYDSILKIILMSTTIKKDNEGNEQINISVNVIDMLELSIAKIKLLIKVIICSEEFSSNVRYYERMIDDINLNGYRY